MSVITEMIEKKPVKVNTEETQQTVLEAFDNAVDQLDDEEQNISDIVYTWNSERTTVRAIIKRYKEGKFLIPACQRLYVWSEEQRQSLRDSAEHNLPCNCITLAEYNGTQYLIDGLQRLTSLIILSSDKNATVEQQKTALNYAIIVVTVSGFTSIEEMTNYFRKLNGGTTLAAIVKERSKLSEKLNDALLSVSGNEFFRTISEKANATFSKSHHHEIIAMNILLAVSDMGIEDASAKDEKGKGMKAKNLCNRLKNSEEVILTNIDKATEFVNRIAKIYKSIDDEKVKRSMNANFVGVLAYVLSDHKEFTNGQVVSLVNQIFANKRAVKEYSETTGSGSGDFAKVQKRYNVLVSMLKSISNNEKDAE